MKIKKVSQASIPQGSEAQVVGEYSASSTDAYSCNYMNNYNKIYYGTCSTGSSTATKVVDCSGFVLTTGAVINVKFSSPNSILIGTLKLNVNSTGAIEVASGSDTGNFNNFWEKGDVVSFIYDGNHYRMINNKIATTSTYGVTTLSNIVERGSVTNKGDYTKFADGTMIVTQSFQKTITSWNSWGTMYSAALGTSPDFPVAFTETPKISVTLTSSTANGWLATESQNTSTTKASNYQVVRPTTVATATYTVNIIAIGKWK